jgi:outer membrane protein
VKKITVLILVAFAVLIANVSVAANSGGASGGAISIGVVDLGRALNEVNEGKKAKANLEKEFKSKKAELENMKNEITKLRSELEKKSHLLSQDAMKEKSQNYQNKFMAYQQKAKAFTEELARKEGESTGKIISKLRTVVVEIAKKDGYTFVLEKSQGGVVYGPTSADITTQVIKRYNK